MIAIILAAGRGTRLGNITKNIPKCLLKIGEKTLLDYQIDSLIHEGIKEIFLVVGYKRKEIEEHLKNKYSQIDIKIIKNVLFYKTDNAYSLALALNQIQNLSKEVIILDGDILFDRRLLELLNKSKHQNILIVDNIKKIEEEDSKVFVESDFVKSIGKQIPGNFIYTSMIKLGGEFLQKFGEELNKKRESSEWYSEPLNRILEKYSEEMRVIHTGGLYRDEIDTREDLNRAKKHLENGI